MGVAQARLQRWFPRHVQAYFVIIGGLTVINIMTGAPWWSFWPMLGWGGLLALHFFYVKAVNVDEGWVDDRVDDLRFRSYDLGHIEDIETRIETRHPSVRPSDEREEKH